MEPLQEGVPLTEEQKAIVIAEMAAAEQAEAERKAAEDKATVENVRTTPRIRRVWRVAITKLLKNPARYLRSLPAHVELLGVNPLGGAILRVTRKGEQLQTKGQGWAMQELFTKLPPQKESVTPEPHAEA